MSAKKKDTKTAVLDFIRRLLASVRLEAHGALRLTAPGLMSLSNTPLTFTRASKQPQVQSERGPYQTHDALPEWAVLTTADTVVSCRGKSLALGRPRRCLLLGLEFSLSGSWSGLLERIASVQHWHDIR
jgi:hypothetical protein